MGTFEILLVVIKFSLESAVSRFYMLILGYTRLQGWGNETFGKISTWPDRELVSETQLSYHLSLYETPQIGSYQSVNTKCIKRKYPTNCEVENSSVDYKRFQIFTIRLCS